MSRRSILLATTFYVAVGSLAAIGPASAHGFGPGGFSGGPSGPALSSFRSPGSSGFSNVGRTPMQSMGNFGGGAKLDHVPSIGTPAAQGNISGPRIEPNRIPAVTNAIIPNSPPPPVRQLPQATTSSGIVARQPDAAGIVSAPMQSRLSAAGIVSSPVTARIPGNPIKGIEPDASARLKDMSAGEGSAKLLKPGSNPEVPNVAGNPTVPGHGPDHGPGASGVKNDGPNINLPGTMGQKGPREVPGFGNAANGPQTNLPGSVDRHGPDDANKALAKSEADAQQVLDTANRGGPNSVNLPTAPGAGIDVSDDTSGKKSGSAGGSKPSGGGTSGGSKPAGSDSGGSTVFAGPGLYGASGTSPTKDGGTRTVVTGQEGSLTYQIVTVRDKNGKTVSTTYSEKGKDGKITTTSTGSDIPDKKDKTTPNDDDSSTIGGLNPNSGAGKTGHGGGTDNNGTETSGGKSTQLANGASLSRTGHGDGTGGHGDNDGVGNDGALAAGTSMARKDYGDGGGSDNRDGGTSLGAPKVGPAGGGSHPAATAAADANAH